MSAASTPIPRSSVRRESHATRQFLGAAPYLLPALLIFVLFEYYPLVKVMWLSLTDADLLSKPKFIGLENYQKMFSSRDFWQSMTLTAIFALGVTAFEVGLGMALAFLMNAPTRSQTLLRGAVFAPVVVSIAATSVVWNYLMNPNGGPLNAFLHGLGLPGSTWLTHPDSALASVILIAVWKGVGLSAVLFLAGLQSVPRELEEAASIDGANRFTIAARVTVPLLAPTTLLVFFISLVGTFQSYSLVLLLTQGGPVGSTNLMGYYIYQNAFQFFSMGFASALSVALFALLLLLAYVQFKLSEKRVHYQ